jgi:hypothetical protein
MTARSSSSSLAAPSVNNTTPPSGWSAWFSITSRSDRPSALRRASGAAPLSPSR